MAAPRSSARARRSTGSSAPLLAIGSLTGALLAARRKRPRVRLVIAAAFGFGVATGVHGAHAHVRAYVVACVPVGADVADDDDRGQRDHPDVHRARHARARHEPVHDGLHGPTPIGSPARGLDRRRSAGRAGPSASARSRRSLRRPWWLRLWVAAHLAHGGALLPGRAPGPARAWWGRGSGSPSSVTPPYGRRPRRTRQPSGRSGSRYGTPSGRATRGHGAHRRRSRSAGARPLPRSAPTQRPATCPHALPLVADGGGP